MQFITKYFLFRKIEMSLQRGILLYRVPETKRAPEMVEEDDPGPGAWPPPQRRADPLLSALEPAPAPKSHSLPWDLQPWSIMHNMPRLHRWVQASRYLLYYLKCSHSLQERGRGGRQEAPMLLQS